MAFTRSVPQEPTSIKQVRLILTSNMDMIDGELEESLTAHYQLQVLDQYGNEIDYPGMSGNAVTHMPIEWQLKAKELIDEARLAAETAIIIEE